MPADTRLTPDAVLASLDAMGAAWASSSELASRTGASPATIKRMLSRLVEAGQVEVTGKARATRYRLPFTFARVAREATADPAPSRATSSAEFGETTSYKAGATTGAAPAWSDASLALRQRLASPLASRPPVTYRRNLVDGYAPNASFLLPRKLAEELSALGRLPGQLPAGTYVRKVLEQLLIDLSWSSSHLEGNRYSLLDTQELFKSGAAATDSDAVMLLNHKEAIEFLVDAVPTQGLSTRLIRNLHAVLMRDLLADPVALGAIREKVVYISGTTYVPTQVPAVLGEMLERIITKAQDIKNPVEASFFLWLHLAYLQPFEDGNKRVSRLSANIPLMLYNHAPLSFFDIDREDYAMAMMGFYEAGDVSMAVDLFDWAYRRSQARYQVVQESMGSPDPFRVKYREAINEAVAGVVRDQQPLAQMLASLGLPAADAARFHQLLEGELHGLADFNCARYRLGMQQTLTWIAAGRPR